MVKVSPDEDSEEQISGICEAVWDSGVDGVIIGNTTKKRPDPLPKGYLLSQSEAKLLLEQGGYSGPQMFERTLALVKKYRKALDEGPKHITLPTESEDAKPASQSSGDEPSSNTLEKLEPKSSAKSSIIKPTLGLEQPAPKPASSEFDDLSESAPVVTVQSTPKVAPAPDAPRKVIFATGGITNGRQAREILDAGASVAQMYTAIVYGGAGTITRVKQEMRDDAKAQKTLTKS
jgi:dihydroorotate dehydrogenase